jgi:acetyl esterase/lipase
MALDDATAEFLRQMSAPDSKPIHEMSPAQARELGGLLREMYGPGPDVGAVRELVAPGPGGDIPVRVLSPEHPPRAVIVYFHGGGWVMGSLDEFDTLARKLVNATGATVVLVDYRLAPEHPYPAAVLDAWAALQWVDRNVESIAGESVPLIVAGDSAGGNLAAVVSQRAQGEGGPTISQQVLIYPVTDANLDTASYLDTTNQLMVSRDTLIWFWDHYAPDQSTRANPDASPLRATDVAGQPPAVVVTAEHDVLRDEGEAYAEKLRAAGVAVQHRRFPGQMHGFFTFVNVLPGAEASMSYVSGQINEHLTDQPRADVAVN